MKTTYYPSIWISDVHLGYKDCKAKFLLDFLNKTECDVLYLVGDIVDLWSMKRQFFLGSIPLSGIRMHTKKSGIWYTRYLHSG